MEKYYYIGILMINIFIVQLIGGFCLLIGNIDRPSEYNQVLMTVILFSALLLGITAIIMSVIYKNTEHKDRNMFLNKTASILPMIFIVPLAIVSLFGAILKINPTNVIYVSIFKILVADILCSVAMYVYCRIKM